MQLEPQVKEDLEKEEKDLMLVATVAAKMEMVVAKMETVEPQLMMELMALKEKIPMAERILPMDHSKINRQLQKLRVNWKHLVLYPKKLSAISTPPAVSLPQTRDSMSCSVTKEKF